MGVQGLWQILEPVGRPVPDIQSLRGKVLAVDASIWLHQSVKGFRDKDGNPLQNAHLLGFFYRVCKLLSCGVKPVFVFDGGVPILKRQTIAVRRQRKLEALDKSEESRQKLLSNFLKQQIQRQTKRAVVPSSGALDLEEDDVLPSTSTAAAGGVSSPRKKNASPTKRGDRFHEVDQEFQIFKEKFQATVTPDLDRVDKVAEESDSSDDEYSRRYGMDYSENFSTITSNDFDVLPLETQHEILFEMQESRKMNSWRKMDQMPRDMKDFSGYQMDRLVKRRFLQKKIQLVQKEMGQRHIHVQNLEELLKMDYDFGKDKVVGSRGEGFMLVQKKGRRVGGDDEDDSGGGGGSQSLEKKEECELDFVGDDDEEEEGGSDHSDEEEEEKPSTQQRGLEEEEEQLALAIQLSLEDSGGGRTVEKARTETAKIMQTEKSEIKQKPNELVFPSASCSKFLDTVGFSSKVQPERAETSDSDDDFEEVEDVPDETVCDTDSPSRSSDAPNPKPYVTINVADVMTSPADDLFADVFAQEEPPEHESGEREPEPVALTCPSQQKAENVMEQNACPPQQEAGNGEPDSEEDVTEEPMNHVENNHPPEKTDDLHTTRRTLGTRNPNPVQFITAEYMQAQATAHSEMTKLKTDKGFQERVATSISDQMSVETQELLALFGIPYIVSPMEAESQCAFLDAACLTDGTITDDSDCWLFGSLRVYKNFYGAKSIEFYQLADIVRNLNLDREKLILLAMLCGGDYCEGIEGVGPVTGMEILAEFPTSDVSAFDTLVHFREWWELVNEPGNVDTKELSKIRQKLGRLKLRPGFPNESVYQAYLNPSIDPSTEAFRWGTPDLEAIQSYTKKKFGWDEEKCKSMLLPVIKNLQCQSGKGKQLTLDTFLVSSRFDLEGRSSKRKKKGSKRLQSAMKKLKKSSHVVDEVDLSEEEEDTTEDDDAGESLKAPKKAHVIPQQVQRETQLKLNKKKAIEIFKRSRSKK